MLSLCVHLRNAALVFGPRFSGCKDNGQAIECRLTKTVNFVGFLFGSWGAVPAQILDRGRDGKLSDALLLNGVW